jgi:autotransporter adhesin
MGGAYWSDAKTGEHSVALGRNAEASGAFSFAVGSMTDASAHAAVAMGDYTEAGGDYSFAAGGHAKARAEKAVALGWFAEADASNAVAIGEFVEARAANSFAIGSGEGDLNALRNTIENSLMVGFDDTEPILFVGGTLGRVGIGTTEPEGLLHVTDEVKIGPTGYGSPGGAGLVIIAEGSSPVDVPLLVLSPDPQVLFRVRGDGNVGVGRNQPLARTHITDALLDLSPDALHADVAVMEAENAILGLYSDEGGTGGSAVTFGEITGGALVDKWAIVRETTGGGDSGLRITYGANKDQFQNSLMMYLDDTGKVGIGTKTFGADRFKVSGSACAAAWNTCSDRRFKTDIERIQGALDKVADLSGVLFRWRTEEYTDKGFSEGRHYGVIAQEVEEVLPEAVTAGPDGEKTVAYAQIIPLLIESIKELKAENQTLTERIEALETAAD